MRYIPLAIIITLLFCWSYVVFNVQSSTDEISDVYIQIDDELEAAGI